MHRSCASVWPPVGIHRGRQPHHWSCRVGAGGPCWNARANKTAWSCKVCTLCWTCNVQRDAPTDPHAKRTRQTHIHSFSPGLVAHIRLSHANDLAPKLQRHLGHLAGYRLAGSPISALSSASLKLYSLCALFFLSVSLSVCLYMYACSFAVACPGSCCRISAATAWGWTLVV